MQLKSSGIGGGVSSFIELIDTFPSYSGLALKAVRVNAAEDALEAYTPSNTSFAKSADWVNVKTNYNAAGVRTTAVLIASAVAGNDYIDVDDVSSFEVNHGIAIPGAWTAGAEMLTTVKSISGNRITLNATIITTVVAGTVYHDDSLSHRLAFASGRHVYSPAGQYNVMGGDSPAPIDIDNVGQQFEGAGAYSQGFWQTPNNDGTLTVFYTRSTDKDVFRMMERNVEISKMTVTAEPSLASTAGAGFVMGNPDRPVGESPFYLNLHDVSTIHLWSGCRIDKCTQSHLTKVNFNAPWKYCLHVSADNPRGGNTYKSITLVNNKAYDGWVTQTDVTLLMMDSCDVARWSNMSFAGVTGNIFMHISPRLGMKTGAQLFNNLSFDTAHGGDFTVLKLSAGAGDANRSHTFTNLFFNINRSGVVIIDIGNGVEDISFDNIKTSKGTISRTGDIIIAGENITINNMIHAGESSVIDIKSTAKHINLSLLTIPYATTSISVNASADIVKVANSILKNGIDDPGAIVIENGNTTI